MELRGRVVFCEKPLIQYVRHGGNASPTGELGYPLYKRVSNRVLLLLNVMRRLVI